MVHITTKVCAKCKEEKQMLCICRRMENVCIKLHEKNDYKYTALNTNGQLFQTNKNI